jgi:hypothetical protein
MFRRPINPYIVGIPIKEPGLFFGRNRELSRLFDLIRQKQCVALVGERRSGRTSLLYQLVHPSVQARYLPPDHGLLLVYVDCQALHTPEELCHAILEAVGERDPSLLVDAESPGTVQGLRRLVKGMGRQGRRLVLLCDEFETIAESLPPEFFPAFATIVTSFDASLVTATKVSFHKLPSFERMAEGFVELFAPVYFESSFAEEEFEEFLVKTSAAAGFPWRECKDRILDLAGRFPFFVQYACWHYFEAWAKTAELQDSHGAQSAARRIDHLAVRAQFADKVTGHFNYIWNKLETEEEKDTVVALAWGQPAPEARVEERLRQKGYVLNSRLFSSAFADFVLSRVRTEGRTVEPALEIPGRGVWIDERRGQVWVDGQPPRAALTRSEYQLLLLLYQHANSICDKSQIVQALGDEYIIDADGRPTIDVDDRVHQLVSRLRRKIPRYIITVHGRGYKLETI